MNQSPNTAGLLAEMRAEMGRQQLSTKALADSVGMTVDQVGRRLAGKIEITVPEALTIAAALRVDLATLLARSEGRIAA